MPIAPHRSGHTVSACSFPAIARASSRWPRAWNRVGCRPPIKSLHHLVAKADWSDEVMLTTVRQQVMPAIERHGAVRAWIIDDTGFPKKGTHSVGVARQYCGQLGKQDNCQVAVSLSVANDHASLPIAYRLYLPEAWANDPMRRGKAGVPTDVTFQTKPQIALAQIRTALNAGVAPAIVLADADYGVDTAFRDGITERIRIQLLCGLTSCSACASVSRFSSAPINTMAIESHIQVMNPIAAPSDPYVLL